MQVLLIEDNVHKLEKVSNVLQENFDDIYISIANSYSEACSLLKDEKWDLVVVDMSLPSFKGDQGGRFRQFGGRDIIRRMKRKSIDSDYLILTQFTSFSDGGVTYSFDQLNADFQKEDEAHYKGMILFKFNDSSWQDELVQVVEGVIDA